LQLAIPGRQRCRSFSFAVTVRSVLSIVPLLGG
jgi:hypothetical protein